jgi:hypothetical protein
MRSEGASGMGEGALARVASAAGAPSLAWLTVVSVVAPLALMIVLIGLAVVRGPRRRPDDPQRDDLQRDEPQRDDLQRDDPQRDEPPSA